MYSTTFQLYLTFALALGSSVSSLPVSTEKTSPTISRRGSAVDAATSVQEATSFLVCSLSYQASAAAYALGTGKAPSPCIKSTKSIDPSPVVTTITPLYRPTAARTRTPTSIPTPPTSIEVWTIPNTSNDAAPIDMSHVVDSLPDSIPSSSTSSTTNSVVTVSPVVQHVCTSSDPTVCAFQAETLLTHNTARAIHHAEPLVWDDKLADGALRWANVCQWKHSSGTIFPDIVYGENLYAATNSLPSSTMTDAVDAFMAEEADYDYNKPEYSDAVGHFTQVVWKATSSVGCAAVNCNLDVFAAYTNSSSYFVCLYSESGNYYGEFAANVQAP